MREIVVRLLLHSPLPHIDSDIPHGFGVLFRQVSTLPCFEELVRLVVTAGVMVGMFGEEEQLESRGRWLDARPKATLTCCIAG
jgi:hypothetical protein